MVVVHVKLLMDGCCLWCLFQNMKDNDADRLMNRELIINNHLLDCSSVCTFEWCNQMDDICRWISSTRLSERMKMRGQILGYDKCECSYLIETGFRSELRWVGAALVRCWKCELRFGITLVMLMEVFWVVGLSWKALKLRKGISIFNGEILFCNKVILDFQAFF